VTEILQIFSNLSNFFGNLFFLGCAAHSKSSISLVVFSPQHTSKLVCIRLNENVRFFSNLLKQVCLICIDLMDFSPQATKNQKLEVVFLLWSCYALKIFRKSILNLSNYI